MMNRFNCSAWIVRRIPPANSQKLSSLRLPTAWEPRSTITTNRSPIYSELQSNRPGRPDSSEPLTALAGSGFVRLPKYGSSSKGSLRTRCFQQIRLSEVIASFIMLENLDRVICMSLYFAAVFLSVFLASEGLKVSWFPELQWKGLAFGSAFCMV